MPGRSYNSSSYRYGFDGMEKDNDVSGGDHYTTLYRLYDPRLGKWQSVDPKGDGNPDHAPYLAMGNNPISYTDPEGDIFGFDNLVGAAVGAAVDYGFQVAGNIANSGGEVSMSSFTDVDKTSIIISAGAGFLTSGASSAVTISRSMTREAIKQVVKKEAIHLAVNTGESVLKQVNSNVKQGQGLKKAITNTSYTGAVIDGAIATFASNIPLYKSAKTKRLEKFVEKSKPLVEANPQKKQLSTLVNKVEKKVALKNIGPDALRETGENSAQNMRSGGSMLPTPNNSNPVKK